MKFLLFNVVVLGALFYLHMGQTGPEDTVTDRIRAHVDAVASTVDGTVERTRAALEENGVSVPPAERVEEPAMTVPDTLPALPETAEPTVDFAVTAATEAADTGAGAATSRVEAERDRGPRIQGIEDRVVAENLPEVGDPAVAQRRDEVLDGLIEAPGGAPSIALTEGAQLMSPEDRRRELYALAEEMEILFLERISK